ncbi:MAG: glycosyltransferase family 2 protein, partial [Acidobacteriota bacterium]
MKRLTIALIGESVEKHDMPSTVVEVPVSDSFGSGAWLNDLLKVWKSDYLLLTLPGGTIEFGARALERFLQVADDSAAGLIYSDFRERNGDEVSDHPLIDYQLGSIRDNFDFGSVLLLSRKAVDAALRNHGAVDESRRWGALYDLRLKLSIDSAVLRIPEPLYTRNVIDEHASGEKIFDYVDPGKRDYQIEMEHLATAHLKRIGAHLTPEFAAVTESPI